MQGPVADGTRRVVRTNVKHLPQAEFISAEDVKSLKGPPANRRFDGDGGDKRDRTVDPLLAKQVLSQLSYTPIYRRLSVRPLN